MPSIVFVTAPVVLDRSSRIPDGFVPRYRHAMDSIARIAELHAMAPAHLSDPTFLGQLDDIDPDLVIAPAYLGLTEHTALTSRWRTILLIEERFPSAVEWAALPLPTRARVTLGRERRRRSFVPPVRAVIINESERRWAKSLLPRTPIDTVPLVIDDEYWSEPVAPYPLPSSILAFIVGSLERESNVRDIALFAASLAGNAGGNRPAVAVASASIQPELFQAGIERGEILWLGKVEDVRSFYQSAPVVVVPTFHVPGTKSTILQAWAAGRPVVTSPMAAASVGGTHELSLLIGDTHQAMADMAMDLAARPDLQRRLIDGGHSRLDAFASDLVARCWTETVHRSLLDRREPPSWTRDTVARMKAHFSD